MVKVMKRITKRERQRVEDDKRAEEVVVMVVMMHS
jgi:hypothetical protein